MVLSRFILAIKDWILTVNFSVMTVDIHNRRNVTISTSREHCEKVFARCEELSYNYKEIKLVRYYANDTSVTIKAWRNRHVKD